MGSGSLREVEAEFGLPVGFLDTDEPPAQVRNRLADMMLSNAMLVGAKMRRPAPAAKVIDPQRYLLFLEREVLSDPMTWVREGEERALATYG